jgi:hypothetical protein
MSGEVKQQEPVTMRSPKRTLYGWKGVSKSKRREGKERRGEQGKKGKKRTLMSIVGRFPGIHRATITTLPLFCVASTAASKVLCVPAQSIATLTPPPLFSCTALTTSVDNGSKVSSAPQSLAIARRVSLGSET